jgi:aconitate hydratase
MFDLQLIKKIYSELPFKVERAKQKLGRPLTYAEKILYSHLFDDGTLDI